MEALKHGARPPAVRMPTFFTFLFIDNFLAARFSGKENQSVDLLLESQTS
jgi:hypothetical protein